MLARRFLWYFLIAATLSAGAAVALEIGSLSRAADRSLSYHLLVAETVAHSVGALSANDRRATERDLGPLQGLFTGFDLHHHSRLMLVDGKGRALYSSAPQDRLKVVLEPGCLDEVRGPATVRCRVGEAGRESEELASIAPVGATGWWVVVSEPEHAIFETLREVGFSSVGVVLVIFAAFVVVFRILSRRLLRPVQRLVEIATGLVGSNQTRQDGLAAIARSLALLERSQPAGADRPPPEDLLAAGERLLSGLVRVPSIASAMLLVRGELELAIGRSAVSPDVTLPLDPATARALVEVGTVRSTIAGTEAPVPAALRTSARDFQVHRLSILDTGEAQLWVGLKQVGEELGSYLGAALSLVSTQLRALLERTVLHTRLHQEHQQKNEMLQHLLEVEDDERRRIAREIHDETSQLLCTLLILLETFPAASSPEDQQRHLARAKDLVSRTVEQTDRLVRRLRPAALEELGLADAVRNAGENILERAGILFELETQVEEGVLISREVENAAYRVVQEAMTNVVKHARARRVEAQLAISKGALRARVADDGVGLDPTRQEGRKGWGLLGMRERAEQVRGQLTIDSSGTGVAIELEVPLAVAREGGPA